MSVAEYIETKGDLANKSFRDIRSAVKSGEALFKTSTSIRGKCSGLMDSEGYWSRVAGRQVDAHHGRKCSSNGEEEQGHRRVIQY